MTQARIVGQKLIRLNQTGNIQIPFIMCCQKFKRILLLVLLLFPHFLFLKKIASLF